MRAYRLVGLAGLCVVGCLDTDPAHRLPPPSAQGAAGGDEGERAGEAGEGEGEGEGGGGEGEGEGGGGEGEGEGEGGVAGEGEGVGAGEGEGEGGDGGEGEGEGEGGGEGAGEGEGEGEGGIPGPAMTIRPQRGAFANVRVGEAGSIDLQLANVGDSVLAVHDVTLVQPAGGPFSLRVQGEPEDRPVADSLPLLLPPEGSKGLVASFQPDRPGEARAEIRVVSNDPQTPEHVVRLDGRAVVDAQAPCMEVAPVALDFRQVAVRRSVWRSVDVRNCGAVDLLDVAASVEAQAGGGFSLVEQAFAAPRLRPGERIRAVVEFYPLEPGEAFAQLHVRSPPLDDVRVALSGVGVQEADQSCRAEVRATLGQWRGFEGEGVRVALGDRVELRAAAVDAPVEAWRWSLVDWPAGSRARLQGGDVAAVWFEPDVVGGYDIELAVTGEGDVRATCGGRLEVSAERDIVVRILWETPGDPDPDDQGPGAGADLDLHMVREPGDFFCPPWDCHYANPIPDWGVVGVRADDASLDIDDTDGVGPEQVSLSEPEDGRSYAVGVHYFSDHDFGRSLVTLEVRVRGEVAYERAGVVMAGTGAWWTPLRILWPSGEIEEIEGGVEPVPPRVDCE